MKRVQSTIILHSWETYEYQKSDMLSGLLNLDLMRGVNVMVETKTKLKNEE